MSTREFKDQAIELRKQGFTYKEICHSLKLRIPDSTLSGWFKAIELDRVCLAILKEKKYYALTRAQKIAVTSNKKRRKTYLKTIDQGNSLMRAVLDSPTTAKVALAMLYLGEGAKSAQAGVGFSNSDPEVIRLFLRLFRQVYDLAEVKFRCTVQCRADQNPKLLKYYWSEVAQIPISQFYKAQIDRRTIGKPTRHPSYHGVCRVTYLSNHLFLDIMSTINVLMGH